ncbi:MAG: hypothetical protein A3G34_05385 [Candidatus Lindowbacteria bacterium RIFCSPLOWO2_12_FULL_62_27]|nr:MAG: hypothetical protein A3G34_05385 [Candidatus Lindowbacteria bacterium RIFCSPLOWO2_12_FULL_62_27]OGH63928.1 MAG: hypothetical protein A3I06_03810 [Candidatus Lindowbacteria bacterium RIFCSPLOWO2_02_FULL_62_12]
MAGVGGGADRLLDAFTGWAYQRGGAETVWAGFALGMGLFVAASLVMYLFFLRLRSLSKRRRQARIETVWRPILVRLLTGTDGDHKTDYPALKKADREHLVQLICHFSVRIPVSQRARLKKFCDETGLSAVFLKDLKSAGGWTRARAALLCGYAGLAESIPTLLGLLKDKDPLVAYDSARSIGMLGDPEVIREVVAVVCRQKGWSRAKIIELLLEFGPGVAMETLRQFLSGRVAPNWLQPMIEIMGHFRVVEARPALEAVARGDDDTLKFAAIRALGRIGLPASDWVLRTCLISPTPKIRQGAAEALGMCMATGAAPDLVELLSDRDVAVRQAAAGALMAFGKKGERLLWDAAARPGQASASRDAAVWALQRASWVAA